jgi:hypothetical protein
MTAPRADASEATAGLVSEPFRVGPPCGEGSGVGGRPTTGLAGRARAALTAVLAAGLGMATSGQPAEARYRPAVSCEVADFSMTLRLYMPLSRDRTGSPGEEGMKGSLEIHHQKVPKDRRVWSLDGKRPAQFWNRDRELKLMLLLGSREELITLIIETKGRPGETEQAGEFRLLTSDVNLSGRLACRAG